MSENLDKQIEEINDILGYGRQLKVLIGIGEDGKQIVKTYHFTPVSLEEIPTSMKRLNDFFNNADMTKWTEKDSDNGAEIIMSSLKRMHPEITKDEIKKVFSLGIMAKAIRIVMDVNDFLSEVQEMNQMMSDNKLNLTPVKK